MKLKRSQIEENALATQHGVKGIFSDPKNQHNILKKKKYIYKFTVMSKAFHGILRILQGGHAWL